MVGERNRNELVFREPSNIHLEKSPSKNVYIYKAKTYYLYDKDVAYLFI